MNRGNLFTPVPDFLDKIEGMNGNIMLVAGAIYRRTALACRSEVLIKAEWILEDFSFMSIRAIRSYLDYLEEQGIVQRTLVRTGYKYSWIFQPEETSESTVAKSATLNSETGKICHSRLAKSATALTHTVTHTGLSSQGTKVPFDDKHETSSSSGESSSPEPFEGTPKNGWSKSQLENLRHYGSVGRPRRPLCDFQPSDEANILQAFSKLDLGEIRAIFTQQQADTPEFVSECLSELSLARRKQGGVRNPIGLLVVIRDKKWADGLFLEREKIKAEEKDNWMDDMVAYAVSCLKRQG